MTDKTPTEEAMRQSVVPKSDQLNFEDVQSGPLIVRIVKVTEGDKEQPVWIHLEGYQPFKPCKTMRRLLIAAWGADGRQWAGRSMELYGDPSVKFGGVAVGGIRISRVSHIDRPMELMLSVTRGKRLPHRVDPLPAEDRVGKFRLWLESKGLTEADATERLGGRTLDEATDEDWKALRAWAKELKPKESA